MRINRLDLLRYGRFTNVCLPFPKANSDLHVIFGPNEAGKSTSLAAIEDLLFGIPHNSPYNFVHDYGVMRVGGVLEHEGKTLEVRRRKGNKDTLLTPDDSPLPAGDRVLMPFLGSADRTFLTRMFSLNHQRLAQGGREILEAKDEVGQTLFSAGAGLSGLRNRIASLGKEADELWAPRKAGHRKYYMALDALEEADKAQREHTVTASKWQEIKRALDAAQEAYETLESQIEEKSVEQRKLSRIRRVYRQIRRLTEVHLEITALGEVAALPADAEALLAGAVQDQSDAQSKINELDGQLSQAKSERAGLQYDEALLMRSDDIAELHKQRIEIQKEKADLPKRRAELATKEEQLAHLAEDVGWGTGDSTAIIARIPQRAKVTAVRTLFTRRGELSEATRNAEATLEEAKDQLRELQDELHQMEAPLDISTLAAAIGATRGVADITTRIKAAEKEAADASTAVNKQLIPLRPQVFSEEELGTMPVPPRNVVQTHRDALRDIEQETKSCRDRIGSAEKELGQRRKAFEQLSYEKDVVALHDLDHARKQRDTGWSLIRRRYIDGTEVPEQDIAAFNGDASDLPTAYERKVEAADTLADRRFDKAEAAGKITVIARQIAEAEESLTAMRNEESVLEQKRRNLEAQWQDLWAEAPFEPLAPEFMLTWLDTRTTILDLVEKRTIAAGRIAALMDEEAEARVSLNAELASLGEDTRALDSQGLRVLLEVATAVQQRHEKLAENKKATEEQIQKLRADETRKQARVKKAQESWAEWLGQWSPALKSLAFADDIAPDVVADHLNVIDDMRALSNDIDQLKGDRIAKIERDIEGFSASVKALVNAVASDLAKQEPEDAVLQLEKRLEEAKRIKDQQAEKDRAIAALEKRIEECSRARISAQRVIDRLQGLASVENPDQLREAMRVSRRKHELGVERVTLEETLNVEGDGLLLSELHTECEEVDLDQISAREESLQNDLKDLRDRLTPAAEQRAQARQIFEAIGGDGRAAQAAAARQEALASMQEAAEQYIRVRTAATLLQWAIDRYRREKQAPLLKRAGRMFGTLTLGSFTDLRVEYDDQDQARLAGIRSDGSSVSIGGMSDGTADQLYLALRLASVDEYLSRAHALPFVADDLLINFDDARAAAGFRVLADLSQKTQVLFFTHHQHLVDIAQRALGDSANIISLTDEKHFSAG
ncbi:MAG: AAA family ATPase [Alphaproteobacteria bacterium]